MNPRAARLAWSLWVLSVLMLPGIVVQIALGWAGPTDLPFAIGFVALQLGAATTGAVISSRLPWNAVGWIFLAMGPLMELLFVAGSYAEIGLSGPGAPLPVAVLAAWVGTWIFVPAAFGLPMFLLLLFPDGRLPSPRWRPVMWGAAGYFVLFTLAIWLSPVSNDFRLSSVRNPLVPDLQFMIPLLDFTNLAAPVLLVAGGAAVISRFRGATGEERQQIKWFAYAITVMVVVFVSWFSLILAGLIAMGSLLFVVPLLGIPVATGVAILKYRLYDIDLVINLTLVYGALSVTLAAFYFGGVVLMQRAFASFTGHEKLPQLAVVASTLAIAALFNPFRRRIQSFVDHRFYRRKYEARKTLEAFTGRLRDETNLDDLTGDLAGVVRETMQPEHVSLWMRRQEEEGSP